MKHTEDPGAMLEDAIRRIVREEIRAAPRDPLKVELKAIEANPSRLYSVAAVAELLEVSKVYVYDKINAGEIEVVELGGTRPKQRVSVHALQQFIDSRTFGRPKG